MHGDDFVVAGMPKQLEWMRARLEEKYELAVEIFGPDKCQQQDVRVPNGVLRWNPHVELNAKQIQDM